MTFDLNWNFTIALCKFNTGIEKKKFRDLANVKNDYLLTGSTEIDKTIFKNGISSLFLKNIDASLKSSLPVYHADNSNKTIEIFFKLSKLSDGGVICGANGNVLIWDVFIKNGKLFFKFNLKNQTITLNGKEINDTDWHHVAITISSSKCCLFLDGLECDYMNLPSEKINDGLMVYNIIIGWREADFKPSIVGHIDSFRITNDIRYSSSFKPEEFASCKYNIDPTIPIKNNFLKWIQFSNYEFLNVNPEMFFIKHIGTNPDYSNFIILEGLPDKGLYGQWEFKYNTIDLTRLNYLNIFDDNGNLLTFEIDDTVVNGLTLQSDNKAKKALFKHLGIHELELNYIQEKSTKEFSCYKIVPKKENKILYSNYTLINVYN